MRTVTAEIEIKAPGPRVLRAFTDIDAMRKWWGVDRGLVDPRQGGLWALAWDRSEKGFRYVTTGIIRSLTAEHLRIEELVYFNPDHMVLGPMQLTVSAKEKKGKMLLTVQQDGYRDGPEWDWYYQAVLGAWPEALKVLKEFLEHRCARAFAQS